MLHRCLVNRRLCMVFPISQKKRPCKVFSKKLTICAMNKYYRTVVREGITYSVSYNGFHSLTFKERP